jgi:nicotinamide-nucleotide adenylyltransferase
MKTALYIGRFQPFHSGHYSVLEQLAQQGFGQVVIGIGSAQYQRTARNPLSAAERRRCIEQTMQARPLSVRLCLVEIPDIHDDATWVDHVQDIVYTVATHYDCVVSGNDWVQRLFVAAGQPVAPVHPSIAITGTQLRHWVRTRHSAWRNYVTEAVADWIEPIILQSHGPDRTEN